MQEVVPPDWLQARVEHVVDQLVPYLRGDAEHFAINLPVADRLEAAVPPVKRLLLEADAYNVVFDELVPWVTGAQDGFAIVVSLDQRKDAMLDVIDGLVNQKIQELADSLPTCSVGEAIDLVRTGFSGLIPSCRPTGYSLDEIKQELGINIPGITEEDIEGQLGIDLSIITEGVTVEGIQEAFGIDVLGSIRGMIVDALPEDFTYTDVDLRETLSAADEQTLEDALERIRNGITYSDTDLREDIGPEGAEDLDRALTWLQDGFTDADMRDLVTGKDMVTGVVSDPDAMDAFDDVRGWLGLGRSLRFLLILPPLLLLAAVGFLGGRRWRSRAAWAAVLLLFAAGTVYVATGPVYNAFVQPLIDDQITKAARDNTGVGLLMVNKSLDVVSTIVDEFVSGLKSQTLALTVVAAVVLGLSVFWSTLFGRGGAAQPQPSLDGGAIEPAQADVSPEEDTETEGPLLEQETDQSENGPDDGAEPQPSPDGGAIDPAQTGVSPEGDTEAEAPLLEEETDQSVSSPDDAGPTARSEDDDRDGGA